MINKDSILKENEKLLVQSFNLQNSQAYDEVLEKLQLVSNNLINIIESKQKNSEFYMRIMPIIKQERQLVSEKDYQQFINKNQRTLSKNFEKNAYLAFLMQEIQEKSQPPKNKAFNNPTSPNKNSNEKNNMKGLKTNKSHSPKIIEVSGDSQLHHNSNKINQSKMCDEFEVRPIQQTVQSKMTLQDDRIVEMMVNEGAQYYNLVDKFGDQYDPREIRRKYNKYAKKMNNRQ